MSKIEVNQISSQCGSTLTIGQSGDTVTLAAGATQSGFGRTGTVDWDTTAKTASFTAVSGTGYFVNTTSGAITVTLPAGSGGSIVSLKDYANTWNTNNITITPNGTDKINGTNDNATLNTQDQSVTLVYVDSTKGWRVVQDSTSAVDGASFITATGGTITTCGDYKIHTFTSPGTFTVCSVGNPAGSDSVDYLVAAGGGGGSALATGANNQGSGGGGAGGLRASATTFTNAGPSAPLTNCVSALLVTATGYPITVGGGGAGGTAPGPCATRSGASGSNSIFSTITAAGGGGTQGCCSPGLAGGSGGGGGRRCAGPAIGGSGNTPPVSPPQGQPGGDGRFTNPCGGSGGGGGGAIAAGGDSGFFNPNPPSTGGAGGAGGGFPTAFGSNGQPSGCYQYFSGGGGGGQGGAGGLGGGASALTGGPSLPGPAGTANTGGGGASGAASGPATDANGGAGGSGIVIIRYKYQ